MRKARVLNSGRFHVSWEDGVADDRDTEGILDAVAAAAAASAPVVLVDDNNAQTVVPVDVVLVVGVAIMAVGVAAGVPVGAWSISPSAGSAASIGYGLVAAFD